MKRGVLAPDLIRISLKGLADYMTSSQYKQRRILETYKYPDEEESKAKILYYQHARDKIAEFHRHQKDWQWLISTAGNLREEAEGAQPGRKRKLLQNSRALRSYAKNYSDREFEILEDLKLSLRYGDVVVTVFPDLHVIENGKKKLIKLEFSKEEPSGEMIKIISQGMFEAAQLGGLDLSSPCILYLDVRRGNEYRGARLGSRKRKEIEAACENITGIWKTI